MHPAIAFEKRVDDGYYIELQHGWRNSTEKTPLHGVLEETQEDAYRTLHYMVVPCDCVLCTEIDK